MTDVPTHLTPAVDSDVRPPNPGPNGADAATASMLLLADAMPQLVWIAAADGQVEYFNRRWYDYTGGSPTGATATDWLDYLHPDDRQPTLDAWGNSVGHGIAYEIEFRLRRADGEYLWHLSRAEPALNDAGRVVRWFGTCTNIHDRKSAELALQHAKDESDSAGRTKDEFLSIVSHELRTPLSAILGWTQLLEMDVLDDAERKEAIQTIKQQAKAQSQLIEDLLDVSRIINGKFHLRFQEIDLARIIGTAVNGVRPVATSNGVTLKQTACDGPLVVRGDPQRLQQVITNLLNNAVKFTPKDGTIEVTAALDGGHACVNVIDTGAGIPVTEIEAIFGRFKQVGSEAIREKGGLGLGLSIVQHVVDAHGGTVRAISEGVGRGSRFEMRLPKVAAAPVIDAVSPATINLPPDGTALLGVRVLVVDDEESARTVIAASLRKAGSEVVTARDAAEAWDLLGRHPFDVLVSDLAMPGHSGADLITRVRKSDAPFKAVAAIALTGFASVDDQTRALAAGFSVHVSKPVEPTELIRRVASLTRMG